MKRLTSLAIMLMALWGTATAQDKLITKEGDVHQVWNVEISDKYVFYNTENKEGAAFQRMEKDKVLMVKRQDGSIVNLYEQAGAEDKAAQPVAQETQENNQAPVMLKPEDLDETARTANADLIDAMNARIEYTPNEDDVDKEANRALLRFGVKDGSVMDDGNVRIKVLVGGLYKSENEPPSFSERGTDYPFGWSYYTNPAVSFSIENKANRTLYIDLGNSFFVRMGNRYAIMCHRRLPRLSHHRRVQV